MKERLVKIAEEISDKAEQSVGPAEIDFDAMISGQSSGNAGSSLPRYNLASFRRIGTFHGMFLRFLKEEMKNAEDIPRNGNF